MAEFKRENNDEITCPYCGYEFSDSFECIPSGDGELNWDEECHECGKEFHVSFDTQNINDGYTTRVTGCKNGFHEYEVLDPLYKSKYKDADDISIYSRYEKCKVCEAYRFVPVKADGSDFTEQEIKDFKAKKSIEKWSKRRIPMHLPHEGVKQAVIESKLGYIKVFLNTEKPQGNAKLWIDLVKWFRNKGFEVLTLPDYLRDCNVRLKRNWIEVEVSMHQGGISTEFYQNEIQSTRKKGDGRYEDNYKIVTPQMRAIFRAHMYAVRRFWENLGFKHQKPLNEAEKIIKDYNDSWHKDGEVKSLDDIVEKLKDLDEPYNDKDANGKKIITGETKYFRDYKGRLQRGVVYHNLNNMWWVLLNDSDRENKASFELFDYEPGMPFKFSKKRKSRLTQVMNDAVEDQNFEKAIVIRDIMKKEYGVMYHIWSKKHERWWGHNNNGYTSDKSRAGLYSQKEIDNHRSYYDNENNTPVKATKGDSNEQH